MRVTQSMLSNNMLRNLNTSYGKMAKLQEQLSSGSKLLRPSDDPVGVTKAISYRTQLTQNAQYDENLDTATKWLDITDDALGQLGSAMQRVQELITQAANDTNQTVDRDKMLKEINQIYEEVKDIGNTKVGDTYIFSGTRTSEPLYGENSKVEQVLYRDANGNQVANAETVTQKDGSTVTIVRDSDGNIASKITTAKDALGATITTIMDGSNNVILPPKTGKYIDSQGNIFEANQDGSLKVSHAKDGSNSSSVDYVTDRTKYTTQYGTVATEEKIVNQDGTSVTTILDSSNNIVAKIAITKDTSGNPVTAVTDKEGKTLNERILVTDSSGGAIEVYPDGTKKVGTLTTATSTSTTSSNITSTTDTTIYRNDSGNQVATLSKVSPNPADGTSITTVRDGNGSIVSTTTIQKDSFGNLVTTVKDKNGNPIKEPGKALVASDGKGTVIETDALGNVNVQYLKDEPAGTPTTEVQNGVKVSESKFKDASGNLVATSEKVIKSDGTYTAIVRDGSGQLISTTTGPSPVKVTDQRNKEVTDGVFVESNGSIITTDSNGLTTITSSKDKLSTSTDTTTDGNNIKSVTTYKNSAGNVISTATKTTTPSGESTTEVKDKDGNIVSTTTVTKDAAGRDVIKVTDKNGKDITPPDKLSSTDASGNYIITDPATGLTTVSTTISAIEGPKTSINNLADKKLQTLTGMDSSVNIEISNGIQLQVNSTGAQELFSKLDTVFAKVKAALQGANGETSGEEIGALLGGTNSVEDKNFTSIQGVQDLILRERSIAGANQNRVDMMANRLSLQKEILTKQQSNVEDVEYEATITDLITQESTHRAALSVGGRVIQQTLVDFIR